MIINMNQSSVPKTEVENIKNKLIIGLPSKVIKTTLKPENGKNWYYIYDLLKTNKEYDNMTVFPYTTLINYDKSINTITNWIISYVNGLDWELYIELEKPLQEDLDIEIICLGGGMEEKK